MKKSEKEEWFNRIVTESSNRIKRICRFYNANLHDQQEVLINIWKSLERFRGDSAIGTWIYRIAVNPVCNTAEISYRCIYGLNLRFI